MLENTKKIIVSIILAISFSFTTNAQYNNQQNEPAGLPPFEFVQDDFIVAALDSLSTVRYFENSENTKNELYKNKYNFLPNFIPTYHDSIYYYRMQKLDVASPINLTYNSYVRAFIDLYASKKRGTTSRVLGLAQYYFPMFEQQLDKYNLPLELKYLAIVESALNPKARSRVGAGGLWQFMYYTGKTYGLELTSFVDDRYDPLKATIAACQHFRDLYNMYHDWCLVLAAYNSGAGNVNKAIRRSGGKMSFWEIMPYLPRETRDYVPAFIAVNYVMAYSNEHNIYPIMPKNLYHETDTITVTQPLTFDILSEKLNLNISDIEFLNPTFRKGFIPATPSTPFYITLPIKSIADFVNNEDALYAYNKLKGYDASKFEQPQDNTEYQTITKRITHKVKKGETLATLARKYDCTQSEIKKWNNLRKSTLYKGQMIKIYVQTKQALPVKSPKVLPIPIPEVASANDSNTVTKNKPIEYKPVETTVAPKYHIVKQGESLSKIATKYKVSTANLLSWNGLKSQKIYTNQKIRINAPTKIVKMDLHQDDKTAASTQPKANPVTDKNAKYHTVKKGEFLAKIAITYGLTIGDLVEWNNLGNTSVTVGQQLRVNNPNNDKIQEETPVNNKDSKTILYTVKAGDTLWSISQQYKDITPEQIKQWNELSNNGVIVGQKLKILLPSN